MKILIAPDSFKESLTAEEVAQAIGDGISAVFPEAEVVRLPVADGGEGTTQALVAATGGRLHTETVTGPLGDPVQAVWGMLGDGRTAVVETAAASGLGLIPTARRDPWHATSRGTGELIMAALEYGVERFIVGLGGSATNDGGAGLIQALGGQLLDREGQEIPNGGGGLAQLETMDLSSLDPRLESVSFDVACDVDNPLVGDSGAAAIFGPQKGADREMVQKLDANLQRFAKVLFEATGKSVADIPGSGAAGGLGAAFIGVFEGNLKRGVDVVLAAVGMDQHLENADLVITGEGRIDGQTCNGKTPMGVGQRARRCGVPVIALAGSIAEGAEIVHDCGIDALFSIVPGVVDLDVALEQAAANLTRTAQNVAKVWKLAAHARN